MAAENIFVSEITIPQDNMTLCQEIRDYCNGHTSNEINSEKFHQERIMNLDEDAETIKRIRKEITKSRSISEKYWEKQLLPVFQEMNLKKIFTK